ncbi:MAG: tRNA (adenosine(37)-N6)-threonylcarbamoyltransferase complex dimerization subunit type 1 TsaB, partial [Caldimonas sp.]
RADGSGSLRVWALLDARMSEIYAAEYIHDETGWHAVTPPMLTNADVLNRHWQSVAPQVVAGNALQVFGPRLDTGAATRIEGAAPRAVGMLTLARVAWHRGEAIDAALALPLYLRDKVAQTTAEREAAKAT